MPFELAQVIDREGGFLGFTAAQWQTIGVIAAIAVPAGGAVFAIVRFVRKSRRRARALAAAAAEAKRLDDERRAAELKERRAAEERALALAAADAEETERLARLRGERGIPAQYAELRKDPDFGFER